MDWSYLKNCWSFGILANRFLKADLPQGHLNTPRPEMTTTCRQKSHVIMSLQNIDILVLKLKDDTKHYQLEYKIVLSHAIVQYDFKYRWLLSVCFAKVHLNDFLYKPIIFVLRFVVISCLENIRNISDRGVLKRLDLIVNRTSRADLSMSRIDTIDSFWYIIDFFSIFSHFLRFFKVNHNGKQLGRAY